MYARRNSRRISQVGNDKINRDHVEPKNPDEYAGMVGIFSYIRLMVVLTVILAAIDYAREPEKFFQDLSWIELQTTGFSSCLVYSAFLHVYMTILYIILKSTNNMNKQIFLFGCFLVFHVYLFSLFIHNTLLGSISRLIVSVEEIRHIYKCIAIFMEKSRGNAKNLSLGTIYYFMFVPTLIYQDSYERCKTRSIRKLLVIVLKMFLVYVNILWIVRHVLGPSIACLALSDRNSINLGLNHICNILIILVSSQYLSLSYYAWLYLGLYPFWAELLRFRDRNYFGNYLAVENQRKFLVEINYVVSDFFKEYFYNLLNQVFTKQTSRFMVLLFSFLLHDIVEAIFYKHLTFYWIYYALIHEVLDRTLLDRKKSPRWHIFLIFFYFSLTFPLGYMSLLISGDNDQS